MNFRRSVESGAKILGLIPARAGSKRIPRKNLQPVGGKTLLQRAIEEANRSKSINAVWVSSEDADVLSLAHSLGAKCHRRNPSAAQDSSLAKDVVLDFIEGQDLESWDVICYLQPTSPFRTSASIDLAVAASRLEGGKPLVSVTQVSEHPAKMVKIDASGSVTPFSPSESNLTSNRQTLEPVWIPNGAIYIFSVQDFMVCGDIPVSGAKAFEMDQLQSLDVDTVWDLKISEGLARYE